jgi:RNA-binding protein
MSTLSQTDLKMLKQAAHHLKPVILIGSKGLSEAVHKEINRALFDHELIKIKVSAAERADRDAMIDEIVAQQGALVVQRVGHTVTVYRKNEQKN